MRFSVASLQTGEEMQEKTESLLDRKRFRPVNEKELNKAVSVWFENKEDAIQQFGHISSWDTSLVQDMRHLFDCYVDPKKEDFNENIGSWDVSNVKNMDSLFDSQKCFNQDIGSWNVAQVTNMSGMFGGAAAFNQDIGSWNVAQVTNMSGMFLLASAFNQDIGSWNVAQVTDMRSMFGGARAFNQDIGSWNVAQVIDMNYMFNGASAFNQDIGSWNVAQVKHMCDMFNGASVFNQDIGSWNVAQVTEMRGMFSRASVFDQDIGSWNVAQVTIMGDMFNEATAFNQNLNQWNVSNVENVTDIFKGATSFEKKNTTSWELPNVKNAKYRWDSDEEDSGKTILWNKEPEYLLDHFKKWSNYLYSVFIFHWIFLIVFPLSLENSGTCLSGFGNMSWLYGVFIVYLIAIQSLEFTIIWSAEEGKRWLKSRSKCFLKCVRVPYWQLPACADIFTAALSRTDLFTDIGFISLVSKCGGKTIYIVSLICFVIGVVGLQFFPPLIWFIYTILSDNKKEITARQDLKKSMKLINVSARSMDMMLISKIMRSMSIFDYEVQGFGNVYSVTSSGNVVDLVFSFIRFAFEDLIQAILQFIYLRSQPDDLSTPSNIFVMISITIAIILSAIRAIVACANSQHRNRCLRQLKVC